MTLLKDERGRVKINSCTALADKNAKVTELNVRITKSIEALQSVAEEDVDGFVRRIAEVNLNLIREWLKEWTDKPSTLKIKIRKEVSVVVNKMKEEEEEKIRKENEVIEENNKQHEKIQRAARKERLEY